MEVGASVWVKDVDLSWISSVVISKDLSEEVCTIVVCDEKSSMTSFTCRLDESSGANDELDNIKLQNDASEATVEDLINLPYLHEPAILHCLQNRYIGGNIYTYTGPILIALNPFKAVPLYTPQILESYYNYGLLRSQGIDSGRPLSPHVYAVADAAYRDMMRVISQNANTKLSAAVNQTILISGESGAGKTESTKIVLRYLTTVGNSSCSSLLVIGSVMDKVLQSNPILESFGNARTLRNDNSSRFGKFIELHFSKRGQLIGGTIRTYLLEKVRLTTQQRGERNFHIMYQLVAGCTAEEKVEWQLTSAEDYWYCNQGAVYKLKCMDDARDFQVLRAALKTLCFDPNHETAMFGAVAGLLHLSQVSFDTDGDGSKISSSDDVVAHVTSFARLCGLSVDNLERVLTVRVITAAKDDTYEIELSVGQAIDARDALSKALYSRLFEWIVSRVNESIRVEESSKVRAEIGVLDIFGFESFLTNSFEQLCINYTNETLQQQFNQFVFKLEQAEYQREEISWSFIEFPDNQDCLDLIEHRQNGILAILDDVCKLPQASDDKFVNRLYKLFDSNCRFTASVAQKRDLVFCVTHYAGPVEYLASSFVEKNKNELPKEAISLLNQSTVSLLSTIFSANWVSSTPDEGTGSSSAYQSKSGNGSTSGAAGGKVASVSTQFKSQLAQLMKKVSSTMPHYIRCLKPNDQSMADKFDRLRTTEQLRYGGVLEAVRVARSGFPVRLPHIDFYSRYRCLVSSSCKPRSPSLCCIQGSAGGNNIARNGITPKDRVDQCNALLSALWEDKGGLSYRDKSTGNRHLEPSGISRISRDNIQCGITKVFLRKKAHDMLEGQRSRALRATAIKIQCWYRTYLVRRHYLAILSAVNLIQRHYRGSSARRWAASIRWDRAVLRVQTAWRTALIIKRYSRFCVALITLQSMWRRRAAKKIVFSYVVIRNSVHLQRIVRGALARIKWRRLRRAIIAIQCLARCRHARNVLRICRAAAKDLGKLQLSNDVLKLEIEQLRAKARNETRRVLAEAEERSAAATIEELLHLREELKTARTELEEERNLSRSLESKLAISELDFIKATAQIIDLRGMIATDESDDDEDEEWHNPLSSSPHLRNSGLKVASRRIRSGERDRERSNRRESKSGAPSSRDRGKEKNREKEEDVNHSIYGSFCDSSDPRKRLYFFPEEMAGLKAATKNMLHHVEGVDNTTTQCIKNHKGALNAEFNDDAATTSDTKIAIAGFERNLATLRSKLRQGLIVRLWEEGPHSHVQAFECLMSLDRHLDSFSFSSPATLRRGAFSLFSQKIEIEPIRVADVVDCICNAASIHEQSISILSVFSSLGQDPRIRGARPNSPTLTIIVRSRGRGLTAADFEQPRIVSLQLSSRDDCNYLLSGMRTLIAASPPQRSGERVGNLEKEGAVRSLGLLDPIDVCHTSRHRERSASFTYAEHERDRKEKKCAHGVDVESDSLRETAADIKKQLLHERTNYERLMLQVFAHTNDLNEKDDSIAKLMKRQLYLETMLTANEKLHEQDAIVRLQLGKRLEQVLLDKEEAYEELDLFKEKLESIQSAMSIIDFSKVSPGTSPSSSSSY